MNSLKWSLMLILITVGAMSAGCREKEVYIPVGSAAPVADTVYVPVYIVNKETGKRERRFVKAKPDGVWYVGRLSEQEIKDENKPAPIKEKSIGERILGVFR